MLNLPFQHALKVEVHFQMLIPRENVTLIHIKYFKNFLHRSASADNILVSSLEFFETETEGLLSLPVSKGKKLRTRKLVKLKKVTDITL